MPDTGRLGDIDTMEEQVALLLQAKRKNKADKAKDDIPALLDTIDKKLGQRIRVRGNTVPRNRIRQVQGSCAIEANPLSLEQVQDVMLDRAVDAAPNHIAEVSNSLSAYKLIDSGMLKPWKLDDMLLAHKTLIGDLMDGRLGGSGKLRTYNVRVGNYIAPGHHDVPKLVERLLDDTKAWYGEAKEEGTHPLEFAASFHYRFESIHPFGDGNGRMGRLWQTLISHDYQPAFAWLPVEQATWQHQMGYYEALSDSRQEDHSIFVAFMLRRIDEALDMVIAEG